MNRFFKGMLVVVVLALGLAVRLYDLTDQPIDFHPTRQLRSAVIARGMYYSMLPQVDPEIRELAVSFWYSTGQLEPPLLERVVAYTYLLTGGENLWISRLYTSFFWMISAVALFGLARRMLAGDRTEGSPSREGIILGGALIALTYYLLLPFAVQASRSFQPDPGMVMLIVLSVYALYRWSEELAWKWAVLAGLFGGIAILTKVMAAYILAGAAIALVLYTLGIKRFWRSLQVYAMLALMLLPTALYYLGRGGRANEYFQNWTVSLSHLLLEPAFYARWFSLMSELMGLGALLVALGGVMISRPRARILLAGLWLGYLVYGLFLPYQMYTHSYYHIQLTPIVALSLAPAGALFLERLSSEGRVWRALFAVVLVIGVGFSTWLAILPQYRESFQTERPYWEKVASYLPTDGKIIGLTQDYGYRLMYYGWRKVALWPNRGEQKLNTLRGNSREFDQFFQQRVEGRNYFLITAFNQLNDQPDLKEFLAATYPVAAEGQGYLIYDLTHRLAAP